MQEIGWILIIVVATIFLSALIGMIFANWRRNASPYKAPPAYRPSLADTLNNGTKPIKITPRLNTRRQLPARQHSTRHVKFSRTGKI